MIFINIYSILICYNIYSFFSIIVFKNNIYKNKIFKWKIVMKKVIQVE